MQIWIRAGKESEDKVREQDLLKQRTIKGKTEGDKELQEKS